MVTLAKPAVDVGLYTDRADAGRAFYEQAIGLEYDHPLRISREVVQHRYRLHGAVLKLNESRQTLAEAPSGYQALTLAGPDPVDGVDPEGIPVRVVAGLPEGIDVSITVASADPDAHDRFYGDALGATRAGDGRYHLGATELRVETDAAAPRAGPLGARGFRYLTVQVFDVVAEHARLLELGAEEGMKPTILGDVAAISFVRDPGGNWIEISQRASLTGPLPSKV